MLHFLFDGILKVGNPRQETKAQNLALLLGGSFNSSLASASPLFGVCNEMKEEIPFDQ